jgi:hypothetical protein
MPNEAFVKVFRARFGELLGKSNTPEKPPPI